MAKKTGPYVGVTGFMSSVEVRKVLAMVPAGARRRLMVGVLMSSKTLAGLTNKWPGRYPRRGSVADIFTHHPQALNLVHYNTDFAETLLIQLTKITEMAGPCFDGFQLNIAWPPVPDLQDYREAYPDKFIMLQIGREAMGFVESLRHFRGLVGAYLGAIDAILIDPSGGKGEPFDAVKAHQYLWALRDFPELGLGVAGGLGPDTMRLISPLISNFPNLSVDAEGRLRTPKPEDALNLEVVRGYIKSAYAALGEGSDAQSS